MRVHCANYVRALLRGAKHRDKYGTTVTARHALYNCTTGLYAHATARLLREGLTPAGMYSSANCVSFIPLRALGPLPGSALYLRTGPLPPQQRPAAQHCVVGVRVCVKQTETRETGHDYGKDRPFVLTRNSKVYVRQGLS